MTPEGNAPTDPKGLKRRPRRGKRGTVVAGKKRLTKSERRDVDDEGRRRGSAISSVNVTAVTMKRRNIDPGETVPLLASLTARTALTGRTVRPFVMSPPIETGGIVIEMHRNRGTRGGMMTVSGTQGTDMMM